MTLTKTQQKEIHEKVIQDSLDNAKDIQKRLEKKYSWLTAKKYFTYPDAERECDPISETVYIFKSYEIDWTSTGTYCVSERPTELETIKELMSDYKFEALQYNLKNKGKFLEVLYCFTKEYENAKVT